MVRLHKKVISYYVLSKRDTKLAERKEMEKIYFVNRSHKGPGVAILMSGKIDFITKRVIRVNEDCFLIIILE